MKASELKTWPNFLKPSEFPKDRHGQSVLKFMDSKIIEALIQVRLNANCPVIPSKNPEAHVRFTGSEGSQHYAVDRLATATDFYVPDNRTASTVYEACKQVPEIKGLGIYFDWSMKKVAFHIDIRPTPFRTQWVCPQGLESREYIFLHHSHVKYYQTLAEEFSKL